MPDNNTPQRDQDVVAYQAFTGLRNEVPPERFTDADLAVADNINLDKSGYLTRRDGYTLARAGAAHSLWSDPLGSQCLFVSNSQLQQLNANYSAAPLVTLLSNAPMAYEKVNDRVYFSNSFDTGIVENGAVRSWGLAVPPLPGVTATVGQMPAGLYQFTLTLMRNDGQESGAPLAGVIELPETSGLNFTLPGSTDPGVVSQLLYLSTPNGEVMYLADVLPVSARSAFYGNDTTGLNTPLNTQFLGPAPAGQRVAFYKGCMFVAQGDTLYASEGFGYELFDLRRYLQLDGRITLLAPMTDREMYQGAGRNSGFFVGTDKSCGVLIGANMDDFQYVPKTDYGAIEGALDYVDGSLFGDDSTGARNLPMFLTEQGICVGMPELAIRNLTRSKYVFTATGRGAALFMPGPNRFIASNNL